MSIIGNVIREEMRLIQMLHIKLPSPHKRTRDIDHNGMFRADCAHYSLGKAARQTLLCSGKDYTGMKIRNTGEMYREENSLLEKKNYQI